MTLTKFVCIAVISPALLFAAGYLALVFFWWAGDGELSSAGRNGETLAAHLKARSASTILVSEMLLGAGLSTRTCTCISTPYANPGLSLVIGDNDITEKFGSELSNDSVVGLMTFEPERHGEVERALISRKHVDFSVSLSGSAQERGGIWCGVSSAIVKVSAAGERIALIFPDAAQSTTACEVTGGSK